MYQHVHIVNKHLHRNKKHGLGNHERELFWLLGYWPVALPPYGAVEGELGRDPQPERFLIVLVIHVRELLHNLGDAAVVREHL